MLKSQAFGGFNDIVTNGVATVIDCIIACITETSIPCRSVEYDHSTKLCSVSQTDERLTPASLVAIQQFDVYFPYCEGRNREC